jgi:hypothetical protein
MEIHPSRLLPCSLCAITEVLNRLRFTQGRSEEEEGRLLREQKAMPLERVFVPQSLQNTRICTKRKLKWELMHLFDGVSIVFFTERTRKHSMRTWHKRDTAAACILRLSRLHTRTHAHAHPR